MYLIKHSPNLMVAGINRTFNCVRYFEDDDCLTNEDYEITWFADPTH